MAGLDAGKAGIIGRRVRIGITDHIKTVGWLTAVNYEMLAKAGGLSVLQSALPMDWFAMYDYGKGIVIQCGPKPELASTEHDAKPSIYVLPNMTLRKIRVAELGSSHQGSADGEPRLAGAAAERWLTRFDIEEDALLAYQAKLLTEPKLTPATTLPDVL